MTFTTPVPFQEAIDTASKRKLMPTSLSTRELRELGQAVSDRSVFSARTTNAGYVQQIKDAVDRLLTPQTESGQRVSFAQMREDLGQLIESLRYTPEEGFPGDDQLGVPPAEAGSLRDLSSGLRLNLLLDTQVRQMLGAGYTRAGNDPLRLEQYPAWEFIRIYDRRVERLDWERRWQEAGGEFFDGRMIARKDSEVWDNLGSTELFPDGLDNPYEPFAWGSGMGRLEVSRSECEELGVIDPDESVAELPFELNESLKADAAKFSPELLDELERELGEESKRLLRNRIEAVLQLLAPDRSQILRNRIATVVDVLTGLTRKNNGCSVTLR